MSSIKLSIVIPTKDRQAELDRAIDSLLMQSELPDEIVVVDDESDVPVVLNDDVYEKIKSVVVVRNSKCKGGAGARNIGVKNSSSEIVAFLDSDDAFSIDCVKRIKEKWSSLNHGIGSLFVGFYWCDENLIPYRKQVLEKPPTASELLVKGNFIGGCSIFSARKEILVEAGGFWEGLGGGEDYDLFIKILKLSGSDCITEPLVYYQSPSYSKIAALTKDYSKQIQAMRKIFRAQNICDRRLMLPNYTKLLSYLCGMKGDKRNLARYYLVKTEQKRLFSVLDLKIIIIFLFGNELYSKIMHLASRFANIVSRSRIGSNY